MNDSGGTRAGAQAPPAQGSPAPAGSPPPRPLWRRAASVLLPAAVAVALLVGALPAFADFSEVWGAIRALGPVETAALLALAGWNILTYQFVIMAALPGLPLRRAFVVGQISTAVSNTVPAGSAVGVGLTYAMFSSFGYSASAIAIASVLTGLWNTFVKLGLPVIALAILVFRGRPNPAMLGVATTGLAILVLAILALVVVASSDRLAATVGRWCGAVATRLVRPFGRGPFPDWDQRLVRFRVQTAGVLHRRWPWLTGATLLSHLSLFVLLLTSLRWLGVPSDAVTWDEALAAFAFIRLITALPITPGGVGLVEVGLTGALVLAGGASAPVVAAVLTYRALSYAIQVPIGVVCWVAWRAMARAD